MTPPSHFLIVGAGAAGLITARELARAGKQVTILEARERSGGRIWSLPAEEFGYPAEGGAEFVHGAAPVTRALLREAGLRLAPMGGTRWSAREGALSPDDPPTPYARRFHQALAALAVDLPIAEFLERQFGEPLYADLRRSITRMVEGYDAADPKRASTFALREEWMARGLHQQGRVAGGYGALIDFLAEDCRRHGANILLGAEVTAIAAEGGSILARCRNGAAVAADAAVLTVPLPLLAGIALPPAARAQAAAAADIGYGNVVKVLLRFQTRWWATAAGRDLDDLSFLLSNAAIPTWWTQHPAGHPVLTGWLGGPRTEAVAQASADEIAERGLTSLAAVFALPEERLRRELVAARAIDWGKDPFARGAYSWATPQTRAAQAILKRPDGPILFSGEALYEGVDMGTVEAAFASGLETAQAVLRRGSTGT